MQPSSSTTSIDVAQIARVSVSLNASMVPSTGERWQALEPVVCFHLGLFLAGDTAATTADIQKAVADVR
jgi:hypothetical protein